MHMYMYMEFMNMSNQETRQSKAVCTCVCASINGHCNIMTTRACFDVHMYLYIHAPATDMYNMHKVKLHVQYSYTDSMYICTYVHTVVHTQCIEIACIEHYREVKEKEEGTEKKTDDETHNSLNTTHNSPSS